MDTKIDKIIDPTKAGDDSWTIRRRLLFLTSFFYMLVVGYCVVRGTDNELFRTTVTFCIIALTGNVGTYVFGASWEDLTMVKNGFIKPNSAFKPISPMKEEEDTPRA